MQAGFDNATTVVLGLNSTHVSRLSSNSLISAQTTHGLVNSFLYR